MPLTTDRKPRYILRIKNSKYSDADVADNDIPSGFNIHGLGWLELRDALFPISNFREHDNIREKATLTFDIDVDYMWLLYADLVGRPSYAGYFPKDPIAQPDPDGSKIVVQVVSNRNATGTVTVDGTVNGIADSEPISINGPGTYVSSKTFTTLDNSNFSCADLYAIITGIFADTGEDMAIREVQLWADTNGDGVYGILFGGYMMLPIRSPEFKGEFYNKETVRIECVGYKDRVLGTQHVAGYRTRHRCANFTISGTGYACALGRPEFGIAGKCTIGDYSPLHPDGTLVPSDYRCTAYTEDNTYLFPYDGYNYREDYSPDTEPAYSWYPEDYPRALKSIARFMNSVDRQEESRPWHLGCAAYGTLSQALSDTDTLVYTDNLVGDWYVGDYILIDDEWMKITADFVSDSTGSGYLEVTRGHLKSGASAHSVGDGIYLPSIATDAMGVASDTQKFMMDFDIGGTVAHSGDMHAKSLGQYTTSRECVFHVDHFKQLHLIEMYGSDPGYGTAFTIGLHDVMEVSKLEHADVINHVYGYVSTGDGEIFCQMKADEITGLEKSIQLFGWKSEEMDTSQLNCVGYDDLSNGKRGFTSAAEAYLKKRSYPIRYQTVKMDSFVPGECHWASSSSDPDWEFTYTDPVNKHIDIKGRQVRCADYHEDDLPEKIWVVEGIRYKANKMNMLETYVTMGRLTTESDFI